MVITLIAMPFSDEIKPPIADTFNSRDEAE